MRKFTDSEHESCRKAIAELKLQAQQLENSLRKIQENIMRISSAFDKLTSPVQTPLFEEFVFKGKKGQYNGIAKRSGKRKMLVLAKSKISMGDHKNLPDAAQDIRRRLFHDGVINSDGYFTRDYLFGSPTMAAMVLCGYSVSGPKVWRIDGMSMKEYLQTSGD